MGSLFLIPHKTQTFGRLFFSTATAYLPICALAQKSFHPVEPFYTVEPFNPVESFHSPRSFEPQGLANPREHMVNNIVGTALLSVITGYIKGDIDSWQDLGRYTLNGAISGYGFHKAKETIGQGSPDLGVAIGYLSASLLENTTLGEHPLAFIRYGAGPFEIRVATPFAQHKKSWVSFDIDAVEAAYALKNLNDADSFGFRYGSIYGITDQAIKPRDIHNNTRPKATSVARVKGVAMGRSMKVHQDFAYPESTTWRHEAIHGMQAMQLSSFLNVGRHYSYEQWDKTSTETQWVSVGLRGDLLFGGAVAANTQTTEYEKQWFEREAFDYTQ